MQPDLVPPIPDRFHLLRERLQRMRRDVERALDVVFRKQRKQAIKSDISAEKTAGDCGRVGGLVGFGDEPGRAAIDLLRMSSGIDEGMSKRQDQNRRIWRKCVEGRRTSTQ